MIRVVACLDRPPAESGRVVTDMPRSMYQFRYTDRFASKPTKSRARGEYARARARAGNAEKEREAVAFEHYVIPGGGEIFFFLQRLSRKPRIKITRAMHYSPIICRTVRTSVYDTCVALRHSMRRDTPRSRFCFTNTRCPLIST